MDHHLFEKRKHLKELQTQIHEAEVELQKKQHADVSLNKEFEQKLNLLAQENASLLAEKSALTEKLNQIVVHTNNSEQNPEHAAMNLSSKSEELLKLETELKEKTLLIEKMTSEFEETQRHMEEIKNQHIQESVRQQNLVKEELAEIRSKEIQSLKDLRDSELKSLSQLRNSGFLQIKDKTKVVSEEIAHNLKFVLAKDFPQNAPILNALEGAIMQVIEDGLNRSTGAQKPERPPIPKSTPDIPKLVPSGNTNHGVNLDNTISKALGPGGTTNTSTKLNAGAEPAKTEKKSRFAALKDRFMKPKKKAAVAAAILLVITALAFFARTKPEVIATIVK
jgi:myosin heavy subunit